MLFLIYKPRRDRQASSLCNYEEKFVNKRQVSLLAIANVKMLTISLGKRDTLCCLPPSDTALLSEARLLNSLLLESPLVKSNVLECIEGPGQSCSA